MHDSSQPQPEDVKSRTYHIPKIETKWEPTIWFPFGSHLVPNWFPFGSHLVPIWFPTLESARALAAAQLAPETGALWLSSPQMPSMAGANFSSAAGCPADAVQLTEHYYSADALTRSMGAGNKRQAPRSGEAKLKNVQ